LSPCRSGMCLPPLRGSFSTFKKMEKELFDSSRAAAVGPFQLLCQWTPGDPQLT